MSAEGEALSLLINGGQLEIPENLLPTAEKLRQQGFIKPSVWQLTGQGVLYAIGLGINPKPYDAMAELPPLENEEAPSFHTQSPIVYNHRFNWVIWLLLVLIVPVTELLIMQLIGYARVLW